MIYQEIGLDIAYEPASAKKTEKQATLTTYILDDYPMYGVTKIRKAVVICPGGGYEHVSPREGEPIALKFNSMGYHAFVLNYSVAPDNYPTQLLELAASVKLIREHGKEWHVDEDGIVVAGFSAGGHLAANLGVSWSEEFLYKTLKTTSEFIKPNGLILCYPVITSGTFAHRGSFVNCLGERYEELVDKVSIEKRITKDMPKTFLWHTLTDGAVPVENSFMLLQEYRKQGVSIEFHLFPEGHHGLSLANEETAVRGDKCDIIPSCQKWIDLVEIWLSNL